MVVAVRRFLTLVASPSVRPLFHQYNALLQSLLRAGCPLALLVNKYASTRALGEMASLSSCVPMPSGIR